MTVMKKTEVHSFISDALVSFLDFYRSVINLESDHDSYLWQRIPKYMYTE